MAPRLLVIDDIQDFLTEIKRSLRDHFKVTTCQSPVRGIQQALRTSPDLILTTLVMKEMDGLEVIRRIRARGSQTPIIMATSYGDQETAAEAIRIGATDYITHPILPAELHGRMLKAIERQTTAHSPLASLEDGIYTRDPEMLSALELAHTVANTNSRILILGETGTGKELFARAIHRVSQRRQYPFVDVNCAAIPEALLESELFGHEKGAFTGALFRRIGRFEEAGEGTLFLDEIGEISLPLQSKLLRVLQNGDFNRVGGQRTQKSKARIVAATNRDLREEVDAGRFRADLYFRLNVVPLTLPPLRRRPDDISLLANHFLERYRQEGNPSQRFSDAALKALQNYAWPGNVRELEHLVERLAIIKRGSVIDLGDLPAHILGAHPCKETESVDSGPLLPYREAKKQFDEQYIRAVLSLTGGNYSAAARLARMERSQFFRMAKRTDTESS